MVMSSYRQPKIILLCLKNSNSTHSSQHPVTFLLQRRIGESEYTRPRRLREMYVHGGIFGPFARQTDQWL